MPSSTDQYPAVPGTGGSTGTRFPPYRGTGPEPHHHPPTTTAEARDIVAQNSGGRTPRGLRGVELGAVDARLVHVHTTSERDPEVAVPRALMSARTSPVGRARVALPSMPTPTAESCLVVAEDGQTIELAPAGRYEHGLLEGST